MYGVICCRWTRGQGGTPWCARLVGFDPKYKFKREFVSGVYDYTYASQYNGRKTVLVYFNVPPGIYEVYDNINRSRSRRYFVRVDEDGSDIEINEDEATECLKSVS